MPAVHAAEDNTIRLALLGCGSRGNGAVGNALKITGQGPIRLYALADVHGGSVGSSFKTLSRQFEDKADVPEERRFVGFDAYKKAIDLLRPGDIAMCTTRSYIRPLHVEYAVAMEFTFPDGRKAFCGFRRAQGGYNEFATLQEPLAQQGRRLPVQMAEVKEEFVLRVVQTTEGNLGKLLSQALQLARLQERFTADVGPEVVAVLSAFGNEVRQRPKFRGIGGGLSTVYFHRLETIQPRAAARRE